MESAIASSDVQSSTASARSAERDPIGWMVETWPGMEFVRQAVDYWVDASQRSVLFLDVLRQRGNNHFEHIASRVPNVLSFQAELVLDGRQFDRPVNYCLVRIGPPSTTKIDP